VVRKGRFATDRPLRTYLYRLLEKSHILGSFNVDLPPYADGHARFTAEIIEALATRYGRQFPGGDFYVLLWPGDERAGDMISYLEERQIKYLVFPTLDEVWSRKGLIIPGDGHPTPAAYRILADAVVSELNLE